MGKQQTMDAADPGNAWRDADDLRALSASRLFPLSDQQPPGSSRASNSQHENSAQQAAARGDWDLNPELMTDPLMQTGARPAAVLIPIVRRAELTVLLTLRPDHMKTHAGQISFPGGKLESHDDGPLAAALRETDEEIGLHHSFIEPLGFLDSYRTGTGFDIAPVVALVQPGFTLSLDQQEVAEAFEVPLSFLMDERNHKRRSAFWRGRERYFHAMTWDDRYIWGATAAMILNLHERLTTA